MPIADPTCCMLTYYCMGAGVIVAQVPGPAPEGFTDGPVIDPADLVCPPADEPLTATDLADECCAAVSTVPGAIWLNFTEKTGFATQLVNSVRLAFVGWEEVDGVWYYERYEVTLEDETLFVVTPYVVCTETGFQVRITVAAFVGGTQVWTDQVAPWEDDSATAIRDFDCGENWSLTADEVVGRFTASGGTPAGSFLLVLTP